MVGGDGGDDFNGGSGEDWVDYADAPTGVTVNLGNAALNTGYAAGDTYVSIENIYGSLGDDDLTGNGSDNRILGRTGNDTIHGGGGADYLHGNGGNDTLFGDAGEDTLLGGDGADTLNGGSDDDTLTGGTGADSFSYDSLVFGQDTITDFQNGTDLLDFTALGLDETDFTIAQAGAHTVLTLISDPTQTVTLLGVTATTIDASDFV